MQRNETWNGKCDINSLMKKNSIDKMWSSINEVSLIEKEIIVNNIIRKEKKNRVQKRNRKEIDKDRNKEDEHEEDQ